MRRGERAYAVTLQLAMQPLIGACAPAPRMQQG